VGGQKMKAVIDTGSFEVVVFGRNCTACGREKHLYDNKKSSNYEFGGFKGIHSYGSGTTYSEESFDSFSVDDGMTVAKQAFWEVYDANMPILAQDSFQVIFGVGPPISAIKMAALDSSQVHKELDDYKKKGDDITPAIMDTVRYYDSAANHAKNITSVAAALNLRNMSVCLGQRSQSDGFYVWNESATSAEPEKFAEVKVAGDLYWSANLTDMTVGAMPNQKNGAKANKIGCTGKNTCSAVIDTGTSLLTAPTEAVSALRELVDAWVEKGGSCDDLSGLPDLEFKLNGLNLNLPPQAYVGKLEGDYGADIQKYMPHISFPSLSSVVDNNCELLIMSMDADSQFGPLWIIGMPFFRKYFTSFEFVQKDGNRPKARSMSFSVADDQCRPGAAPNDVEATEKLLLGAPHEAHLYVNAKKILVPSLARRAHEHKSRSLYGRPVFPI
jgi:hypothetical protein